MKFGLDYLGGANFGAAIKEAHPVGFGAGFILNTNKPTWSKTNAWPIMTWLLKSGRCPFIRMHAMWEDNHEYVPVKHDNLIFAEYTKALQLRLEFPGIEIQFSPFCESNAKGAQLNTLFKKLRARNAGITLVNSVFQGDFMNDFNVVNEVHGSHKKPTGRYNYSHDGSSSVDADVESDKKKHSTAEYFYLWVPQFNGRLNSNDPTPRNRRQAFAYSKLIKSVAYLANNRGLVNLSADHIWKTHADQHNSPIPEPRAGKPVFISKVDAPRVDLVGVNGKVVATLRRAGNFTDRRPMYRSDRFGYELAELALDKGGSSVVALVANGKTIGNINPAFRAGSFR